ncbi:ABC transporter ATP-binding protein [Devriesea agamarum]|uniref:ABC transporter ATP-binding protein n=1 Tax=Devriesea agamarum TaxID=472569 RepID=UPI00071C63AC|nr:ATP-binding cassette domain-containing protein [Devriesea agamarum]
MKLEVRDLAVDIGHRKIFSDVNLSCQSGQLVALVGASGSGKTTLLNCLGQLQRASSGSIRINGEEASHWSDRRRARFWRQSAAFVYQDYGIVEEESVGFNVALSDIPVFRRRPRITNRLRECLDAVGLGGRESEPVSVLSGGEKQRCGVARALYKKAECLFVDEPTASLDAANRKAISELLVSSARSGALVIVATHDDQLAAEADQTLLLS